MSAVFSKVLPEPGFDTCYEDSLRFFMIITKIHIGHLIQEELRSQGRSVAWFARELGIDRTSCYRIFGAPSIDTLLLIRISLLLKVNFFTFYIDILQNKVD